MKTVIMAKCVDQTLRITNLPKLSSGGIEETQIVVTFCEMWDGMGKTAVFYRNKGKVYEVIMVDDACTIPYEVMTEPGKVYFGVTGVQGGTVRTSEVVALTVQQGSIIASVPVPLPDVYKQILTAYGQTAKAVAVERARINNLVAGGTVGDAELLDVRVGADGETYTTAGEAVREQASVAYALRTPTPITYIRGSITNGVEEPSASRARFASRVKANKAVVTIQANANYNFGYAVYNDSGVGDGIDHGWNAMADNRLVFDSGYFSFNFRRVDNASINDSDLEAISSCVTVKQINIFSAIEDVERYAVDGLPLVQSYALEVGTIADGTEQNHANRCRFVDKVAVTNKTTATFKSLTDYMYGYSVYDETGAYDGIDHGWNAMYGAAPVSFQTAGYVQFNFRRIDDAPITATDLATLTSAVTIETAVNALDAMADAERRIAALEQNKKDALASINVDYGRVNGASYVLARIPRTTNAGHEVRLSLALTSADGSIDGTKNSTLDYARKNETVFAVNAGLFNTNTLQPVGQTIINGVAVVTAPMTDDMGSPISNAECYPLCIDGDGNLSAPYTRSVDTTNMIADGVAFAVTGWGKVIENFEPCSDTVENEIVHAGAYIRQVIGQYQNGDYFVCTVDMSRGSVENEAGITYADLAALLVSKGVKFAYSLDGGGSAETVLGARQLNPIYEGATGRAVPTVLRFDVKES